MSRYFCYACGGNGHRCHSKSLEEIQATMALPTSWPPGGHERVTYAVSFGALIKVGTSLNFRRRLKDLTREHRGVVAALGLGEVSVRPVILGIRPGSRKMEKDVLNELAPYVAFVEWHQNTPEVRHILVGWSLDSLVMPTGDYRAIGSMTADL